MESVLNFINDNYIWIIIIALVLLMALIGYIAEQQGFGNTKDKKKKEKPNKKIEEPIFEEMEETVVEEPIEEVVEENPTQEEISEEFVPEQTNEEETEELEPSEEPAQEIEEDQEDLYAPLGDKEFKSSNDLNIDKVFNDVLDDVEETANEADIELPNLDTTDINLDSEDDEDIWKF